MRDYHKYIYDTDHRRIIGDFDGAYKNCEDTWPSQHDVHLLKYQTVCHKMKCLGPAATLLDVGCGYGDYVAFLRRNAVQARGFEVSSAAVEIGRKRFDLGEFLQVGDLKHGLPCNDATFDVIVLFGVFWFLLDRVDESMLELRRLLKPGGEVAISITMVENPIGKEVVGNYDDFLNILRRHFSVEEVACYYDSKDIASGKRPQECSTDLVAYCRKRSD